MSTMAIANSPEAKLIEVRRKSFREQAIWFLNSSDAGNDESSCELVRTIEEKCSNFPIANDHEGESAFDEQTVDEQTAHRLLEYSNKPCTSADLRKFMDTISNKGSGKRRISLAEVLTFQFEYDWQQIATRPECRDVLVEKEARDELKMAKAELNKLTEAAKSAAKSAEEARQSEARALKHELAGSKSAENAKCARISHDEARRKTNATLDALKLQEDAKQRKKDELKRIASDRTKGIVARNRAHAELAILLSEDPIGLRTARIQQEAAVKKMTAAAKKAEDTVAQSQAALMRAASARKESMRLKELYLAATKKAEEAIPSAQDAFDKTSHTLDEIMKQKSAGKGTLYFIQSDLDQSRQYLPQTRFVVAQKRADAHFHLAVPQHQRKTI